MINVVPILPPNCVPVPRAVAEIVSCFSPEKPGMLPATVRVSTSRVPIATFESFVKVNTFTSLVPAVHTEIVDRFQHRTTCGFRQGEDNKALRVLEAPNKQRRGALNAPQSARPVGTAALLDTSRSERSDAFS